MTAGHSKGDVSSGVGLKQRCTSLLHHLPMFLSSALTYTISLSIPLSFSAMFLDWQSYFHVSRAETASVHSTSVAILFGGSIIPGYLVNRFGARITVVMGTCLSTTGLVISAFATSIPFLIASTGVLCGLGSCLTYLPCIPCVTSGLKEGRSLVIAIMSMCGGSFGALLPHILRHVTGVYGWRGTFFIVSGLSLNTLVTGLVMTSSYCRYPSRDDESIDSSMEIEFPVTTEANCKETNVGDITNELQICLVKNSADDVTKTTDDVKDSVRSEKVKTTHQYRETAEGTKSSTQSKWRFMKDPLFLLYLANVSFGLASIASFTFLFVDFANTLGLDGKKEGVFFLSVVLIASLVSRLTVGVLNMFPAFHSFAILSTSSAAGGCLLLTFAHVTPMTPYPLVMVLLVLYGFAFGGFLGIHQKVSLDMESVDQDTYPLALGVANSAQGISYLWLPSLVGYAVDQTGSYLLPLSVMGGSALCVGLSLQVAACRRRRGRSS